MIDRGVAERRHVPVMRDRIVELLAPALQEPGSILVDGTLGMGGHAAAILRACPHARVIGIDRDTEALQLAGERLAEFGDRFTPVHSVYDEIDEVLSDLEIASVQGALFDLGVSSLQLDAEDRGFAYRVDAPLDMRMDQSQGMTAADVLNIWSSADLEQILKEYGEERFARKIARQLVERREVKPWETSGELVDLLSKAVPAASQRSGGHPAKRTFQALRIAVNEELSVWADALPKALEKLSVDGRIVVMSYHSLEDRITKRALVAGSTSSAPPEFPVELPEHEPWLKMLTRGAEKASETETASNSRAASVRVRAAMRIKEQMNTQPGQRKRTR
ncbi:16S rRNA (cytosine(1402)-N(4))-methyltransferase RsmH [Ornithinimicrobium sp. INDO-MA30-4]|uniref:16S rRNA (cytosine(1402)-N(4))-methyltransferase RsmH n=1 Tax=Ornithinimicrobium sp. INDO-MA30-4 TaxID=2908651 RepID=UPI001F38321D|nr:16S rRNA (cytosine(1402)-N(4))-methyltransferase RsmH [Ornithinimicrobium sp. INDO-MA30-4]UJH71347.1 16S rRNA (cytosine(1402)-N(4))-methyltransferase RsmH [Ornithinimicrobium sp. INDO-MA30-4]